MDAGAAPSLELDTETARVLAWRELRFLEMGFSEPAAVVLAGAKVDLHDCWQLIQRGCSHELAIAILT